MLPSWYCNLYLCPSLSFCPWLGDWISCSTLSLCLRSPSCRSSTLLPCSTVNTEGWQHRCPWDTLPLLQIPAHRLEALLEIAFSSLQLIQTFMEKLSLTFRRKLYIYHILHLHQMLIKNLNSFMMKNIIWHILVVDNYIPILVTLLYCRDRNCWVQMLRSQPS